LQEWCCRRVGQRRQRMRKVPGWFGHIWAVKLLSFE
jgi:hypothetical protein